jgi:hypothetical protein
VHLRIYKLPDVVSTIRPLKFAVALDLRLFEVSPVDVPLSNFGLSQLSSFYRLCDKRSPLFVTFTVNVLSHKISAQLDFTPANLFNALASHFVLVPHSVVLGTFMMLGILALTVEKPCSHHALVNRSVIKRFCAFALRLVVFELTSNT